MEVEVGQRPPIAGLAFPDDRGLVAARAAHVAVQAVDADVQLAADEPLRMRRLPVEHGRPRTRPLELACQARPERFGISLRFGIHALVGRDSLVAECLAEERRCGLRGAGRRTRHASGRACRNITSPLDSAGGRRRSAGQRGKPRADPRGEIVVGHGAVPAETRGSARRRPPARRLRPRARRGCSAIRHCADRWPRRDGADRARPPSGPRLLHQRQVHHRLDVTGLDRQRHAELGGGAVGAIEPHEGDAQVVVGRHVPGIDGNRPLKLPHRIVRAARDPCTAARGCCAPRRSRRSVRGARGSG